MQQEKNLNNNGKIDDFRNVCGEDILLSKTKFAKITWNYLYYINCKKLTLTNQNFENGFNQV